MTFRLRAFVSILIPMFVLAVPSSAKAANLCVKLVGDPNPAADCSGGLFMHPSPNATPLAALQAALNAAKASLVADRLVLANAIYDGQTDYHSAPSELEIVGESKAGVVLTSTAVLPGNGSILTINNVANVTVRSLTLRTASNSPSNSFGIFAGPGVRLIDLLLEDVTNVDRVGHLAQLVGSASLEDSVVNNRWSYGVSMAGGSITNTLFDSEGYVNAGYAITTLYNGGTIRRSRFQGGYPTIIEHSGTTIPAADPTLAVPLVLEDSILDLGARTSAWGVRMVPFAANVANQAEKALITIRRNTVVGTGDGQRLVMSEPYGAGVARNFVTLDSTLIDLSGANSALVECDANGPGAATNPVGVHNITATNSSYATPNVNTDGSCDMTATGTVAVAPTWQDAATFKLRWDAPQRDAGDPAAVLAPGALDFAGLARLRDGNGDGTARIDIGAVEYQPTAPVIDSVTPVTPATAHVSRPLQFTAGASDALAEGTLSYQWSFDGVAASPGASVSQTFTTVGAHTATITVRDGAGTPASQTITVNVTEAPATPMPPDRTAPRFAMPLAPTTALRRTGKPLMRVARGTRATAIRLTVLERVRLQVRWQTLAGRAIGATSDLAGIPAGTRWLTWGGRIGSRAMAPGCYRLQMRALDAANNSSPWRSVRVCLARR